MVQFLTLELFIWSIYIDIVSCEIIATINTKICVSTRWFGGKCELYFSSSLKGILNALYRIKFIFIQYVEKNDAKFYSNHI